MIGMRDNMKIVDPDSQTKNVRREFARKENENAVKETDKFVRSYLKVAHICSTSENIHDCYSEKVSNIAGRTYDYEIAAGENIYVARYGGDAMAFACAAGS